MTDQNASIESQYPQKRTEPNSPEKLDWDAIRSRAQKRLNRIQRPWQGKRKGKRPKGMRFKSLSERRKEKEA